MIDYFAYGSNLHPRRLSHRVGDHRVVSVARLEGYRLCFHKIGKDGSGKCNAFYTGRAGDRVYGVLFRIARSAIRLLDEIEGAGRGYHGRQVLLQGVAGLDTAYTYLADPDYIDDDLLPFGWYKQYVLHGARHHGLPASYIKRIADLPSLRDQDHGRRQRHLNRLKG